MPSPSIEAVDVLVVAEQRPYPTEIAELLLAHGADQHYVADGAEAAGVHGVDHRKEGREATGIVADPRCAQHPVGFAHGDVGGLCKYGIEVRGDDELRPAAAALSQSDDIAFAVDCRVAEAEVVKSLQVELRPRLLLERRGRNLGDPPLLGQRARIVGLDLFQRLRHRRVRQQRLERCLDRTGRVLGAAVVRRQ